MNVLRSCVKIQPVVDYEFDMSLGDTRFYTAYISCARLLKCKTAARQTVVSGEWD